MKLNSISFALIGLIISTVMTKRAVNRDENKEELYLLCPFSFNARKILVQNLISTLKPVSLSVGFENAGK